MSIKSRRGFAIAAVTLLALLVIVMPGPVSAQKSFECQMVWKGPSADNNLMSCLTNKERIKGQLGFMVLPILNTLLFIVILLGFPISVGIIFACSDSFEQTSRKSTADSRWFLWMWIAYAVLCGCCMVTLVSCGAGMLVKYSPSIVENTLNGPLIYFNETAERIMDFTSNWSTGERVPLSSFQATIAPLTMVQIQVRRYAELFRKNILGYVDKLAIVSYCVSGIGFVFLLLLLPLALFRYFAICTSIGFSCVYWLFGIFVLILALSLNLLSVHISAGCGEVELQYQREPGVLQWYLIPSCKAMLKLDRIRAQIRMAEFRYSMEGCKKLLRVCDDNDPDISTGRPPPKSNPARKPLSLRGGEALYSPYSNIGDTARRDKLRIYLGRDGVLAINPGSGKQGSSNSGSSNSLTNTLASVFATSKSTSKNGKSAPVKIKLPKAFDKLKIYKGLNSSQIGEKVKNALQYGIDISGILGIAARPFKCGRNITSSDQCYDFDTLADILTATTVKRITSMCPNANETCAVTECALNCNSKEFKEISKMVVDAASVARNASIAVSYVKPLLECNFISDKFLAAFSNCNDLRRGTLLLGVGFFIGGLMFGLAIYIMLRGSCVWRTPSEVSGGTDLKGVSGICTDSTDSSSSSPASHTGDEPEEKNNPKEE